MKCNLCPNACNVDRDINLGMCGLDNEIHLASAMIHKFEEPVISGKNGTAALFFSGCTLSCVFCQNKEISQNLSSGKAVSSKELIDIINNLVNNEKAETLSLITATQFLHKLVPILKEIKPTLSLPIVYNCGGYESVSSIKMLNKLVDVYLPDFKYFDNALAEKYSNAKNYKDYAFLAIDEMLEQTGAPVIENGIIKSGVIIRHLVLPSLYKDSEKILKSIAKRYGDKVLISLMRQYTPDFCPPNFPELKRKVTTFEYNYLLNLCESLSLNGFSQEASSASASYTPRFKD